MINIFIPGTVIALTGSPSPGGPYSKHSVAPGPDGSRFVFPPPPTMYSHPHENWTRRELFRYMETIYRYNSSDFASAEMF